MTVRARLVFSTLIAATVLLAVNLAAQSQEKGLSFYEEYRGSSNSLGQVTVLDSSIGYNFNRNVGVDVGIPIYFVHPDQNSLTNWHTWNDNIGDLYLDARFHLPNHYVNYNSIVTVGTPTGSFDRGFSTGRVTIDWDNRIDHRFGRLTPFLDASIGNSLADRHFFTRPFRTLGFVSEFEGGSTYRLWRFVHVGASYYDVLPGGDQKIYSQLFQHRPFPSAFQPNHGRVFETAFETTGPASIVRDNGYTGWLGLSPIRNVDLEVGYNRSVRYDLDTVSFRVGLNAGNVVRGITSHF